MTKEETEAEVVRRAVAGLAVVDPDKLEGEMKRFGLGGGTKDPDIPACDACCKEFRQISFAGVARARFTAPRC
jgi:hypothetical protein